MMMFKPTFIPTDGAVVERSFPIQKVRGSSPALRHDIDVRPELSSVPSSAVVHDSGTIEVM
jgi:hypothetical protein